jgi:hypothetical protein
MYTLIKLFTRYHVPNRNITWVQNQGVGARVSPFTTTSLDSLWGCYTFFPILGTLCCEELEVYVLKGGSLSSGGTEKVPLKFNLCLPLDTLGSMCPRTSMAGSIYPTQQEGSGLLRPSVGKEEYVHSRGIYLAISCYLLIDCDYKLRNLCLRETW